MLNDEKPSAANNNTTASSASTIYVGQYPCRIAVQRRGSQWIAVAELSTANGPIRFAASADEDVIARRLGEHAAVSGFDLGQMLGQVAQSARQLAQARSVNDVMRTVSNVVREPIVADAVAFIPGVGPVASVALRSASTLLDRSERGDSRSLSNLGSIATAARGGNPLAGQAMQVLASMHRQQRRTAATRFHAKSVDAPAASKQAAPYTSNNQSSQSADLGGLLSSLFGNVQSDSSNAESTQGQAPGAGASSTFASGGRRSIPAADQDAWRVARPEERTPAEHRAAYQSAIASGLGDAYREAATVGGWEGARWLWNEVRPQPYREGGWSRRSGYAEGVRVLAAANAR